MERLRPILPLLLAPLIAIPATGQILDPLGADFVIPTSTFLGQTDPDAAALDGGGFVVVWTSNDSAGTDVGGFSLQGQRYDPLGTEVAAEFQLNAYTTGSQQSASVAALPGGGFVVAWESYGSIGDDQSGPSIQFRRFDTAGLPIGHEVQATGGGARLDGFVRGSYDGYRRNPSVASRGDGTFVIAWESFGSTGNDTLGTSIQVRRFTSSGAPIDGELQVNTTTTGGQTKAVVATDDAGQFVVVWQSESSAGSDADGRSVQMQRFGSSGAPLGSEVQVNEAVTGNQVDASLARSPDGTFLVGWSTSTGPPIDILTRRFDSGGTALGGETLASPIELRDGRSSDLAIAGDDVLVVWSAGASNGNDTDALSIQGRFLGSAGGGGPALQLNTYTTNTQSAPAVAVAADGTVFVAWHSNTGDGSGTTVRGRVFLLPIFGDGFESGSTAAWSSP